MTEQTAPQIAKVGQPAPDFSAEGVMEKDFETYNLMDYRDKWVVLFFYPKDFTFVCPTEITGFSTAHGEFEKLNATVFGCSTDSIHSHKAWLKDLGKLKYPLLSDDSFKMSRDYNVFLEDENIALRGTFIIDPEGILRYALYHDLSVGRSVEETLRVLSALQTGELCPIGWKPGEKTLGNPE